MRLSTQSRYGVRAIFDIAYHSEGLETQVKDISRRQGISQRYLEQIFQKLGRREGIKMKEVFNLVIPELLDIMRIQRSALFSVS